MHVQRREQAVSLAAELRAVEALDMEFIDCGEKSVELTAMSLGREEKI